MIAKPAQPLIIYGQQNREFTIDKQNLRSLKTNYIALQQRLSQTTFVYTQMCVI